VSWPLSTVLYVTTKTKPARTAVKSVTASTTAPTPRTSPPASFVVSVATVATWRKIVPIDLVGRTGATTTVAVSAADGDLQAGLALDLLTLLTKRCSRSWLSLMVMLVGLLR